MSDVYCRDYEALSKRLVTRLPIDASGSTIRVALPPEHTGGTLFVSAAVGPTGSANVDGRPRDVDLVLDTFGAVSVQPDEQIVAVSMARTGSNMLSVLGMTLLAGSFLPTITPFGLRYDPRPPVNGNRKLHTSGRDLSGGAGVLPLWWRTIFLVCAGVSGGARDHRDGQRTWQAAPRGLWE